MNAYSAQRFFRTMAILVILAGLPTTQAVRADDPNGLPDGADLFAATWESATLAITTYNPIE
jgi:hypothetical protein